jgi:hypothetical protein
MNFKLFACAIGFSAFALNARTETPWKDYTNYRFGFRLKYPASLVSGPNPDNGAGRAFRSQDKEFCIVACGHFLQVHENDSLEKRWRDDLKALGKSVNYRKKASSWYVLSGITEGGVEYYRKLYVSGTTWAAFHITYPHAKNKKYDPWVVQIEKSFIPFVKGRFDRIQDR